MSLFKYLLTLTLFVLASPGLAAGPLVDAGWALKQVGKDNVVFLDIQSSREYQQFHIPGAVNAPYSSWRTGKKQPPRGMLLPVKTLEKKLGDLGIAHNKRVVIVATGRGAGDMAAAARVYWTLQVLGHNNSAVLNGGLIAYAEAKGQLEKGVNTPKPVDFKAKPNMKLLIGLDDVKKAVKAKTVMVDARSTAEYLGVFKGGDKERAGNIPGSKNLPYDWLTVNGSGEIQNLDNLKKLFKHKNMLFAQPRDRIHYCHTGSRAALNWFVDYALFENPKARLYDGSTQEWSSRSDTPLKDEVKVW